MIRNLLALGATTLVATAASGQIVGDFDYQSLAADFQVTGADTGVLSIVADGNASGSVGTSFATEEYALFSEGFAVTASPANFVLNLNLSNITGSTADATGSFTITDFDGDTLTGTISGSWERFGGVSFFTADAVDVNYSNPGSTFDGDLASFVAPGGDLFGALTILSIDNRLGSTFFSEDVRDVNVAVQAQFIPTPGALALFGLGLGGLTTRRRR